jgi:ribulose-5-phosphate 4-epimerase/fuculose-1-phosphate aldolase
VLRRQLAAAYRLVDHFGWTELIYGHLTARVPGEAPHFLINPFGLNYDEVTASNLVKIDLDGKIVEPSPHPVNYAGFVIHSAVHMAHAERHKVVMHTHTRAGMAVCALKDGLLPVSMVGHGVPRQAVLSRLRGPQPRPRRARAAAGEPRQQPGDDAAQPRAADHGPLGARGLPAALPAGAGLPDPGRRGGGG